MLKIRKAERRQSKLRIGLSAPSGAGKTYSALKLAQGLASSWDKIGIIDTENGSADLYAHFGEYNVLPLEAPYTPERYIEALKALEEAGMEVIIIDSMSHEWDGKGGLLQSNEVLATAKFKGNGWAAWSESTPKHQTLLEAITTSPVHIITTTRNKVETMMTDGKVKKVGIKEIQRDGFEYELTVSFNIDRDTHMAIAGKDRTELFEGKDPFVITEKTGEALKAWSEEGQNEQEEIIKRIEVTLEKLGTPMTDKALAFFKGKRIPELRVYEEKYNKDLEDKPKDPAPAAPKEKKPDGVAVAKAQAEAIMPDAPKKKMPKKNK